MAKLLGRLKRYCSTCGVATEHRHSEDSMGEFFLCLLCEKKEQITRVKGYKFNLNIDVVDDIAKNLEDEFFG